jgi:hypothetical protein
MQTDKTAVEKGGPRDERDLEVSYGKPIPQSHMKKGDFVNFGILAGSTDSAPSVEGVRTTTFGDSVTDAAKNL